jgi:CPA2 family monovalent cation:H+ antiporter-2
LHLPAIIQDLANILGVAAVVTLLFRMIKQPVILGYIVAGVIVGPHTPSLFSVKDVANIQVWAELGVIFLMFSLGLEFSFRRLLRVGMPAVVTGSLDLGIMFVLGVLAGRAFGWTNMDAIFLGCMVAISSTTIIVKAFEELKLKGKRFAEIVFGVLIIEDLAAVLMLVALTNIVTTSQIGGLSLLLAGGKLALVIGIWFIVGMFLVPRLVRKVSKFGNDEMLTVVAAGLCFILVGVAAYFQYSVALGAFMMGSILAESNEAKRIEHLVQPLRDIFGAVFFVSVGMLLDPHVIYENLGTVLILSLIIIVGKVSSVLSGSLLAGQGLRSSVRTGFSMAQIGEFSFIIAALGMSYGVISAQVYPIVVAASILTTFSTPYLIKSAVPVAKFLELRMPPRVHTLGIRYGLWLQSMTLDASTRSQLTRAGIKWALNAIAVMTIFTVSANKLLPLAKEHFDRLWVAPLLVWGFAFLFSSPSLWAMMSAFRGHSRAGREKEQKASERKLVLQALVSIPLKQKVLVSDSSLLISRLLTVAIIGVLSAEYFPAKISAWLTILISALIFTLFRKKFEVYYGWLESRFKAGFDNPGADTDQRSTFYRLAPWDAHLVEVKIPTRSFLVGLSLVDLKLREIYGLNVVFIKRGESNLTVAPRPSERLFPGDRILCFATDEDIERFINDLGQDTEEQGDLQSIDDYESRCTDIQDHSPYCGISIRRSEIRENFACIIVGLERDGKRLVSPSSDTIFMPRDRIWIVGSRKNVQALLEAMSGEVATIS